MNATPVPAHTSIGTSILAGALSLLIAIGLLAAVAHLFLREGFPLQAAGVAERACSEYLFVSERQACMQSVLAASYHRHVASR
jgi:hypothetical protein